VDLPRPAAQQDVDQGEGRTRPGVPGENHQRPVTVDQSQVVRVTLRLVDLQPETKGRCSGP